jgi:hypothetical protein
LQSHFVLNEVCVNEEMRDGGLKFGFFSS